MKKVLSIAGSDSGAGAGIQADLKTFSALGVYGMTAITSVTAQNTTGVSGIQDISPDLVLKQIDAVFSDIGVDAVKIGMVSNNEIIMAIAEGLKKWKADRVVLDPVMISESGSYLLQKDARETLINELIPLATIITPNLYEGMALANKEINSLEEMEEVARDLYNLTSSAVLLKGGHLSDKQLSDKAIDIFYDGDSIYSFEAVKLDNRNTHGTGCTYSSAIAAYLSLGFEIKEAIAKAKNYISEAIRSGIDIGQGPGPTNHFFDMWKCE
ncbi:bifunctional hydroxymethylpyrimidine kinase/phosphomethylpyrimidine kinase [Natronospora cellulosivora (SeqCode)]